MLEKLSVCACFWFEINKLLFAGDTEQVADSGEVVLTDELVL